MANINLPSNKSVLAALLRADFITQWRNRRSMILILLIPVIILLSWMPMVPLFGGAFVLSNSITIGLTAIGLMGYSNSIARDRDKGIFQRLRVAPLRPWTIMASRLAVQLAMILTLTTTVFITGARAAGIILPAGGYFLGFVMAFIGGAVYLGLGQAIVGLIKNVETVNAVTRLVYFVFIMVGMFAEMGKLGEAMAGMVRWSPYGTVKDLLATAMDPGTWNRHSTVELGVTVGYAVLFSGLGIKWFRWAPAR